MAGGHEKNKVIFERCQILLTELLKDEDNKYCVDCDAKSPRWAAWNLGVFLCIRCAGIHRNLGVHISKVKSVTLDTWTPQQVECMKQMGNSRGRAVYEANVDDDWRRPQSDSALEHFIRGKYENKKYIAKEWIQPPMPNPTWHIELEKQLKKKKDKKASTGKIELPDLKREPKSTSKNSANPQISKTHFQKENLQLKKGLKKSDKEQSNATVDLLGLDSPPEKNANNSENSNNIFGEFLTATPSENISPTNSFLGELQNLSPPLSEKNILKEKNLSITSKNATILSPKEGNLSDLSQNATIIPSKVEALSLSAVEKEESDFFNQNAVNDSSNLSSEKLSKDSILALYGKGPSYMGGNVAFNGVQNMPIQTNQFNASLQQQYGMQMLQHNVYQNSSLANGGLHMGSIPPQPPKKFNSIPLQTPTNLQSMIPQQIPTSLHGIPNQMPKNFHGVMPQISPSFQGMPPNLGIIAPQMGIQLSPSNPFAKMQNQLNALNLGSIAPHNQPAPGGFTGPLSEHSSMVPPLSGTTQPPTLSNDLWR